MVFLYVRFSDPRVADGRRFAGSQIDLAAVGQGEFVDTLDMFAVLDWDEARKSVSAESWRR